MTNGTLVTPTDLRDYAKARGWTLLAAGISHRLYVLEHPHLTRRQLVFPIDTSAPDYTEAVMLAAEKLAEIEAKPLSVILASLQEVRDDTLRFRITLDHNSGIDSLPLSFATSFITAAQQLLLSAACTVLKPRIHHPRLSQAEAQQLVKEAQFRHTEHSSFVLKVSCAIDALDVPTPFRLRLFEGLGEPETETEVTVPFVRRTMLTLHRAVRELVTAIEADRLSEFVDEARRDSSPIVSSNLCEALTRFQDEALNNSVEMAMSWAVSFPTSSTTESLRIQRDYFPRIEEVRRALRSTEEYSEDTFIGTVEQLNGEMGDDGRRSGEVILALLPPEGGETIRARTNLTAPQYEKADKAHMTEGVYVRIAGKLHPGRQPRMLIDISNFDLVWARPQLAESRE
jgi:hypothetical protein